MKLNWKYLVAPVLIYPTYTYVLEYLTNKLSHFFFNAEREKKVAAEQCLEFAELRLPFIYHPRYNITACGLENLHPFDSIKYQRVFNSLKEKGIINSKKDYYEPSMPSRASLLTVLQNPSLQYPTPR